MVDMGLSPRAPESSPPRERRAPRPRLPRLEADDTNQGRLPRQTASETRDADPMCPSSERQRRMDAIKRNRRRRHANEEFTGEWNDDQCKRKWDDLRNQRLQQREQARSGMAKADLPQGQDSGLDISSPVHLPPLSAEPRSPIGEGAGQRSELPIQEAIPPPSPCVPASPVTTTPRRPPSPRLQALSSPKAPLTSLDASTAASSRDPEVATPVENVYLETIPVKPSSARTGENLHLETMIVKPSSASSPARSRVPRLPVEAGGPARPPWPMPPTQLLPEGCEALAEDVLFDGFGCGVPALSLVGLEEDDADEPLDNPHVSLQCGSPLLQWTGGAHKSPSHGGSTYMEEIHCDSEPSKPRVPSGNGVTASLATECVCGSFFIPDSLFCRMCGAKRPAEVYPSAPSQPAPHGHFNRKDLAKKHVQEVGGLELPSEEEHAAATAIQACYRRREAQKERTDEKAVRRPQQAEGSCARQPLSEPVWSIGQAGMRSSDDLKFAMSVHSDEECQTTAELLMQAIVREDGEEVDHYPALVPNTQSPEEVAAEALSCDQSQLHDSIARDVAQLVMSGCTELQSPTGASEAPEVLMSDVRSPMAFDGPTSTSDVPPSKQILHSDKDSVPEVDVADKLGQRTLIGGIHLSGFVDVEEANPSHGSFQDSLEPVVQRCPQPVQHVERPFSRPARDLLAEVCFEEALYEVFNQQAPDADVDVLVNFGETPDLLDDASLGDVVEEALSVFENDADERHTEAALSDLTDARDLMDEVCCLGALEKTLIEPQDGNVGLLADVCVSNSAEEALNADLCAAHDQHPQEVDNRDSSPRRPAGRQRSVMFEGDVSSQVDETPKLAPLSEAAIDEDECQAIQEASVGTESESQDRLHRDAALRNEARNVIAEASLSGKLLEAIRELVADACPGGKLEEPLDSVLAAPSNAPQESGASALSSKICEFDEVESRPEQEELEQSQVKDTFELAAQARGASEALLLDEAPEQEELEQSQDAHDLAAKTQGSLEALLLDEAPEREEPEQSQDAHDLAAKAQGALEALLLDEAPEQEESEQSQDTNDLAVKAQVALEAFFLLLDDVPEQSQDTRDLAAKAQGALEALLLDDADEQSQDAFDLAVKAQGALEALLLDDAPDQREDTRDLALKAQGDLEDLLFKAQGALEALFLEEEPDQSQDTRELAIKDTAAHVREMFIEASLSGKLEELIEATCHFGGDGQAQDVLDTGIACNGDQQKIPLEIDQQASKGATKASDVPSVETLQQMKPMELQEWKSLQDRLGDRLASISGDAATSASAESGQPSCSSAAFTPEWLRERYSQLKSSSTSRPSSRGSNEPPSQNLGELTSLKAFEQQLVAISGPEAFEELQATLLKKAKENQGLVPADQKGLGALVQPQLPPAPNFDPPKAPSLVQLA